MSESLATLTSHNKYTKNYCKFTENNIRTERYILEYLETYSLSSTWTSEERTRRLSHFAERIAKLLQDMRCKHNEQTDRSNCKEIATQTILEYRYEDSYISFKTTKAVSFDDWQE